MNYLNITKYIYLVIGLIMTYDAISNWNNQQKPWLSVILACAAFFTYFFRNKFAAKFEKRRNEQNQNSKNDVN